MTAIVTVCSLVVALYCLSVKGTELTGWLLIATVVVNGVLLLIGIMRKTRVK